MSRYLFAVSLGPVQEFIAAARRTRDLWMGSTLLSELAKAAARAAQGGGAELIFPAPEQRHDLEPGSDFCAANKLLFLVETEEPGAVSSRLRDAMLACLGEHSDAAMKRAAGEGLKIDYFVGKSQVENVPEMYVAWQLCPTDGEYKKVRQWVERMLSARKSLRNFGQHHGTGAFKNTIDGVREDIIEPESRQRYRGHSLKEAERLDGIGVLKRFGGIDAGPGGRAPQFDSTQDIGAVPYARRLLRAAQEDSQLAGLIQQFIGAAESFGSGHRPFVPGFRGAPLGLLLASEKDVVGPGTRALEDIRQRLHRIERPPSPYYALLMADGDHMGKALDACPSPGRHRELSQRLAGFASSVRTAIETTLDPLGCGLGTVIYAGGDDLMAFLPLDTALAGAVAANRAFTATVGAAGWPEPMSLSAGLVVAHAQDDLTAVVEEARRTLEFAKEECNRKALAVRVARRSGAPFTVGGHWDKFPRQVNQLLAAYRDQEVPFGLGYEWRHLAAQCDAAKVQARLVNQFALATLRKKADSAGTRLQTVVENEVKDSRTLRGLANLLILAKALYNGGAEAPETTLEATR